MPKIGKEKKKYDDQAKATSIFRHSDQLHVTTNGSEGHDIWGMEDFQFTLGDCSRCTRSFEKGPTAFIANKDGPIRALRSWVGANSGMLTQRDLIMYEQRTEETTFLRLHTMPSLLMYINFNVSTIVISRAKPISSVSKAQCSG